MMKKRPVHAILLLTLPTLVVAIAALILMQWRIATRVKVELTVDRAVITVGGTDWRQVMNAVRFTSITVQDFSQIKLSPAKLEVADPAQYIFTEERYPESAWKPLGLSSPVVITAGDRILQPAFTLEGPKAEEIHTCTLDRIWAQAGAELTLEVIGGRSTDLFVKVQGHESSASLSLQDPFQFVIDHSRVDNIANLPYQADSLTFRGQLMKNSPAIEIRGQPGSLIIILTAPPEEIADLFPEGGIPVTALDFTRQYPQGRRGTSVVKEGEISYPDYPKIDKVIFKASDFIGLRHFDEFYIQGLSLDPEHKGIQFSLIGVAGHLRTGTAESSQDHRLTLYDTLLHNSQLMILFSVVLWVFPTTVGAYRLYKELSK